MNQSFIFTCAPESSAIALNELAKRGLAVHVIRFLSPGVGLVTVEQADWNRVLRENPPVFIRHLCPVQFELSLADDGDRVEFAAAIDLPLHKMEGDRVAVQVRSFGEEPLPSFRQELTRALENRYTANGAIIDVRNPEQIVSVVYAQGVLYQGISTVAANLSAWPGGECRFARDASVLSRAEFKLLEALDIWKFPLAETGEALDLGASPGGWTRVLRSQGMRVTAVDPAELAPVLMQDAGVRYEKKSAQEFLRSSQGRFSFVVNDMKMDVHASAELMGLAVRVLLEQGYALMTLKLPTHGQERTVAQVLDDLKRWYNVLGARQLFHNRSEVTVLLQKHAR